MRTADYTYDLPPDKIAFYPLAERDGSKLLVYRKGQITHDIFRSLPDRLPGNAFLFFNNTKVIPARIHFYKDTGASIEVFLLSPLKPSPLVAEVMVSRRQCQWQCTIGNLKKWTSGSLLTRTIGGVTIKAALIDRKEGIVGLTWDSDDTFAEVIVRLGETPLPPYIRRDAAPLDAERYQTIYSDADGAVAAPTAGLHFTEAVFAQLKKRGIGHDFLTLHVGAGTFQPIKTDDPAQHAMHEEPVHVTRRNIENLLVPGRFCVAVGTTSMRTLESLYWYGVRLLRDPHAPFAIHQNDPYEISGSPPCQEALSAVGDHMKKNDLGSIWGRTSIFIRPGYRFRVCQGLITNFHQPASTLILLVAAFVGGDWRRIYDEALSRDYRFLSYGDSSLLIP